MSEKRKNTESVQSGAVATDLKLDLFRAAVSATLRIIVPVFVGFLVGLGIDFLLNQTAFYAIIGAVAGFAIAGWLIHVQLKNYKKHEAAKTEPKGKK